MPGIWTGIFLGVGRIIICLSFHRPNLRGLRLATLFRRVFCTPSPCHALSGPVEYRLLTGGEQCARNGRKFSILQARTRLNVVVMI